MINKYHLELCLDSSGVLDRGVQASCLYRLFADLVKVLVPDSENLCELWHNTLGHFSLPSVAYFEGHGAGIVKLQD